MQVSAEELTKWFIESGEILQNVDDGASINFADCINEKSNIQAVFYTKKTGFVIWMINRTSIETKAFRICARKFSLDSDLIYGAISKGDKIAIIGRERSIPIYILPPMRTEMLELLAKTPEKGLSQSYERTNIFSGKLSNHKDYAPIYLSDELWHTEYGSILNITDQMLKSWSENGSIQYDGFGYLKPIDWAFDKGAVHDLHTNSLTYNWNTAGAGYLIDYEDNYKIYAVNRTGSLPISYIPGETDEIAETDSVYLAEELAYDFFSGLSNPELVRVAQYAIMYQIFTNFKIKMSLPEDVLYPQVVTTKLNEEQLSRILKSICQFHNREFDDETEEIRFDPLQSQKIEEYYDDVISQLLKNSKEHSDSLLVLAVMLSSPAKSLMNKIDSINHYIYNVKDEVVYKNRISTLLEVLEEISDKSDTTSLINTFKAKGIPFLNSVSHFMINPREMDLVSIKEKDQKDITLYEYSQLIAYRLINYKSTIRRYADILELQKLEDAKEAYVSENRDKSLFWIKCPTIVQSMSVTEDSLYSVGGHDLNSKITPVKIDESLKPGTCRVDVENGEKIIYVSSADKGYITPEFLRLVERTNYQGTHAFERDKFEERPRDVVASATVERSERGFNVPDHLDVVELNTSGELIINGKIIESCPDLYQELAYNAQNNTGTSPKQILFKAVSEDMVQTIIDGTQTYLLSRGEEFKIPNKYHNFAKAKFKKQKDGSTLVSIPIEGTGIKAKESKHVFRVPTSKVEAFKTAFKELISDPLGVWNQFHYKRKMKKLQIQKEDFEDWIEHNKVAIIMDSKKKDIYYVKFIQEEIA